MSKYCYVIFNKNNHKDIDGAVNTKKDALQIIKSLHSLSLGDYGYKKYPVDKLKQLEKYIG